VILNAINQQKRVKSAGPDGVAMEAFIYGGSCLTVHFSILYSLFLKHCFAPERFIQSTIVPLVKCKGGDLTDANNYRAITLSNACTKILESVMLNIITNEHDADKYQFGFRKGHSTGQCTSVLKNVVDYYSTRGSHVFTCFVDFTKAFDRVNYWKLFTKLLDDNIPYNVVALLSFWYSHQQVNVRWHNVLSGSFCIGNGTRQGGILSPYLFTRYIAEAILAVVNTRIGCNIGGVMVNILAYADDLVLLAPSWDALQELIIILELNMNDIDVQCNTDKTVCMVFNPKCRSRIVASYFPIILFDKQPLQFVSEFRYLGHIINNEFKDDNDIKREIRNLFMRTNLLIRRFAKCSVAVKLQLFKSYCLCLYDAALWKVYRASTMDKLNSAYHKCIKIFFKYNRCYSVTSMLQEIGLPTFSVLIDNYRSSFKEQLSSSCNNVVSCIRRVLL
jgi:hypothetical protein